MLLQIFVMKALCYSAIENKMCKSVYFVKHVIINCRINLSFTPLQISVLWKSKGSQDVYGFYNQMFVFSVTIKLTSGLKIIKFRNKHNTLSDAMIGIPVTLLVRQATWKSMMSARVCMRRQLHVYKGLHEAPIMHMNCTTHFSYF